MSFGVENFKKIFICLMVCFLLSGCPKQNSGSPVDDSANRNPYLMHTVSQPGETLGVISAWYTKRSSNWQAIARANPSVNPNRIRLGQTILIPRELVVEASPLPASFVRRTGGVKQKSAEAAVNAASSVETTASATSGETATTEEGAANAEAEAVAGAEAAGEPVANSAESAVSAAETKVENSDAPPQAEGTAAPVDENSAAAAHSKVGDLQPEDAAGTPGEQPSGDAEREKLLNELLNE
jgi:hypothetical protein